MKAKGDKAYAAYLDAKCLPTSESETGEHRYTPEAIEGMQRAILDALRADGPLAGEIRDHLAFAFEEVCVGIESDLLSPVRRGHGRERPIAKHMQAAAIRYLRWVKDGRIKDKRPTAKVAEAYGVTDRAVRGWMRAWGTRPTPGIDEAFGEPGFEEVSEDEEVSGYQEKKEKKLADTVTKFMMATGRQYHRFIKKPVSNPHSGRLKANR